MAEAYRLRGFVYGKSGKRDLAIRDYTKAIELKPDDAGAYYNRGVMNLAKGVCDRAIQDFTKAIELKPGDTRALYNRAVAYCVSKAYDKAWADVNAIRQLGGKPDPKFIAQLTKESGRSE